MITKCLAMNFAISFQLWQQFPHNFTLKKVVLPVKCGTHPIDFSYLVRSRLILIHVRDKSME